MATPTSIPPTTADSSAPRHRQRHRYRLPNQRKKRKPVVKLSANLRGLIALGILLLGLLVAIVVIAFHLIPTDPY